MRWVREECGVLQVGALSPVTAWRAAWRRCRDGERRAPPAQAPGQPQSPGNAAPVPALLKAWVILVLKVVSVFTIDG